MENASESHWLLDRRKVGGPEVNVRKRGELLQLKHLLKIGLLRANFFFNISCFYFIYLFKYLFKQLKYLSKQSVLYLLIY